MIQGLKAAHFDEPALRVLFALLDPEGNYFLYRRVWGKTGGLPFLHPHVRKYAIDGEDSLSEVFPLEISEKGCRSRWSVLDWGYRAHSWELSTGHLESGQADDKQISNYWEIWVKPFVRSFCAFGV